MFKPLYGFVTASFRLFGSRRRAYLATAGLLACGSCAARAIGVPIARETVAAVVVGLLAVAVSDVVADEMAVENARALASALAGAAAAGRFSTSTAPRATGVEARRRARL